MKQRCFVVFGPLITIASILWPGLSVHAQQSLAQTPSSIAYEYSPYEQETIDLTISRMNVQIDPSAEGKIIDGVDIVTLEVIEPRDPLPRFLNVFHVVSKRSTIEREVLLKKGDLYQQVRADETARNLRKLPQLSVVICVAVRTALANRVRLLVITKDIWSLRLNSDIRYSSGGLEYLALQPAEMNLFGTHHSVAARFFLDPAAVSFGAQYTIPRISSHHIRASVLSDVIVNRDSGKAEGCRGSLWLGSGLVTDQTRWTWRTTTRWNNEITRRFINAKKAFFDWEQTPQNDHIPFEYRVREVSHSTSVTHSWGWRFKDDLTFGVEYDKRDYTLPSHTKASAQAIEQFRKRWVPVNDTRLSPFVQYSTYTTDFLRTLDFEILGLQEDFRLGHVGILKVYPASSYVGSSRTLVGILSAAQYSFALRDGLFRIAVQTDAQIQNSDISDAKLQVSWRVMSPKLGFGRLVADCMILHRYRNFLNKTEILGGNNRLRGYPSNFLIGRNAAATNMEFRSSPLELYKFQIGGAVFYDIATVSSEHVPQRVYQSAGLGIRTLLPQLDRIVFRVDVGFPLAQGSLPQGVSQASFYAAVGQAFSVPYVRAP